MNVTTKVKIKMNLTLKEMRIIAEALEFAHKHRTTTPETAEDRTVGGEMAEDMLDIYARMRDVTGPE